VEGRGRRALFVGGTPLYLKALLHGLFDGPPADEALRRRLTDQAERDGREALHRRLAEIDPAGAARLHPNDVRRVVRALEVWELTGRPLSAWQTQWAAPADLPPDRCLCLDLPRPELYRRIDARVEAMIAGGWVEEARALRGLGRPLSREAAKALGYREVFDYLDGRATLEETASLIRTRSRQLAKRQLTWFRHLPGCRFVSEELTFALWGLTIRKDGDPGASPEPGASPGRSAVL
jgi:tRNA dimethylallyltransferase